MKTWQKVLVVSGIGAGVLAVIEYHQHHDYQRYVSVELDDVVLDVGAGTGSFAVSVAQKASLIVALEPAKHAAVLKERIASAGLSNVIIVEKAAWDRRAVLPLYHTGYVSSFINGVAQVEVQADTLDNIVSELGLTRVDFIKMDIEGAEVEALEGAENTLRMARKVVIAAYHRNRPDIIPTYPWVSEFLQKRGFRTKITHAGFFSGMGLVHAWKES